MNETYEFIKQECLKATTTDPIELIFHIMKKDYIRIHGPEHHILDGACFLVALHNAGMVFDLEKALDEMIERGSKMPGATCGQWGVCGSTSSLGAALSIVHGSGPLSYDQYYKDHLRYTSYALLKISEIGGPRCCKRNAFLSIQTAIDFVNEHYDIILPKQEITCEFSSYNKQCLLQKCPYFKKGMKNEI